MLCVLSATWRKERFSHVLTSDSSSTPELPLIDSLVTQAQAHEQLYPIEGDDLRK